MYCYIKREPSGKGLTKSPWNGDEKFIRVIEQLFFLLSWEDEKNSCLLSLIHFSFPFQGAFLNKSMEVHFQDIGIGCSLTHNNPINLKLILNWDIIINKLSQSQVVENEEGSRILIIITLHIRDVILHFLGETDFSIGVYIRFKFYHFIHFHVLHIIWKTSNWL